MKCCSNRWTVCATLDAIKLTPSDHFMVCFIDKTTFSSKIARQVVTTKWNSIFSAYWRPMHWSHIVTTEMLSRTLFSLLFCRRRAIKLSPWGFFFGPDLLLGLYPLIACMYYTFIINQSISVKIRTLEPWTLHIFDVGGYMIKASFIT